MEKIAEVFDCPVISVRVIDADTQSLVLDRGWRTTQGVTTRVHGIDAPEMSTAAGKLVAKVAEKWLTRALETPYQLRWLSHSLDMYGRSIGDFVDRSRARETFSEYLLRMLVVAPYSGLAKRDPWPQARLDDVVVRCNVILAGEL